MSATATPDLASLDQRIADLEAILAAGQDALQPNVITVAPDGSIGADFTGHVSANGIDLPAATSDTPESDDQIRWISAASGGVVADISGFDEPAFPGAGRPLSVKQATLRALATGASDQSVVFLSANDDLGNSYAFLEATQTGRGTSGAVLAFADSAAAPGHQVTIINSSGVSTFPQFAAAGRKVIVDSTATGLSWPGGTTTVGVAYLHGQPAPADARYFAQYIDAQGTLSAWVAVRSASTAGCTFVVGSASAPAAGTAFGLYIWTELIY